MCPADKAIYNADSYSFVAAGVWFSNKLGKEVPKPADPPSATMKRADNSSCPASDMLPFDGDENDPPGNSQSPSSSGTSPTSTPTPTESVYCTNPSLEDGDGICTCNYGTVTFTTFTPSGGPGNECHASTIVPPEQRRAVYTTTAWYLICACCPRDWILRTMKDSSGQGQTGISTKILQSSMS
jgi:hypothetical protein